MSVRFDNQVAIITGAGGGLGRAHALAFAERGAKIVVNDLGGSMDGSGGSSDAAEAVVAEIRERGGEAIANGSSVTDREGVAALIAQAMEAYGRIDILVNNAGVLRDKSFANMSLDDFDFVMGVHLTGAAYCTHAVWPIMRAQAYGRIVMTTSTSGLYGNFGQANYGAGKMGQVGLMQTLKIEGAKYNIRVNALAPVAATRMTEDILPAQALALLKPESVSPAVLYLASPDAPTGAIMMAGAGHFAMTRLQETEGILLKGEVNVDDVVNNMTTISDYSNARNFTQGSEQTGHVFQKIQDS